MEFKDVVYGRRSVRKFKDTPVDDKILKEIVDAALVGTIGSESPAMVLCGYTYT